MGGGRDRQELRLTGSWEVRHPRGSPGCSSVVLLLELGLYPRDRGLVVSVAPCHHGPVGGLLWVWLGCSCCGILEGSFPPAAQILEGGSVGQRGLFFISCKFVMTDIPG